MSGIAKRLQDACVGHPHATVPWPHRLLHDAADELEALAAALQFYAEAWDTHPGDSGPGGNTPQDPVCDPNADLIEDGGKIARDALARRNSE